MKKPRISMIAAIGENRELGKDNKLLFDIPEDMKFFRETTRGKPVIMGRKTAEHLVEFYTKGPLPGRKNIVVTRNADYKLDGFTVTSDIEHALEIAQNENTEEIFIIGGGEIYKLGLPFVERLYVTIVKGAYDADVFFPEYDEFSQVLEEKKGISGGYEFVIQVRERK